MPNRLRPTPDPRTLPEPDAARVLGRASELDAALSGSVVVDDLRLAASEAGISERAFDAALAEYRTAQPSPARVPERRGRRGWIQWAVTAAVAALAVLAMMREPAGTPSIAGIPMVDEAPRSWSARSSRSSRTWS
jgi:hypothetical protein